MRNYSQEVARAASQRTRDLDNKGNNHLLLVRWHHPMLIDLPDLPILRVFRECARRLGARLHHVLREALHRIVKKVSFLLRADGDVSFDDLSGGPGRRDSSGGELFGVVRGAVNGYAGRKFLPHVASGRARSLRMPTCVPIHGRRCARRGMPSSQPCALVT